MPITGFDHLLIAMPSGREADARRYYGHLLGLPEIVKPPGLAARGGAWFQAPGFQIHLGVERDFRPARKAHPCLRVSDLDALARDLQAAGYPVIPDSELPGVRRFYSEDPFGNRIEFQQEG